MLRLHTSDPLTRTPLSVAGIPGPCLGVRGNDKRIETQKGRSQVGGTHFDGLAVTAQQPQPHCAMESTGRRLSKSGAEVSVGRRSQAINIWGEEAAVASLGTH